MEVSRKIECVSIWAHEMNTQMRPRMLTLPQAIESRGIHIIPYNFLQRRFKSTNVQSLIRDNVAFKLSFGLTFALAAFAEF